MLAEDIRFATKDKAKGKAYREQARTLILHASTAMIQLLHFFSGNDVFFEELFYEELQKPGGFCDRIALRLISDFGQSLTDWS